VKWTTLFVLISIKLFYYYLQGKVLVTLSKFHLLFSIFSLAAILVGSRDHRTQFWKGAIQGPFHQSLVQIGPATKMAAKLKIEKRG
jgi:uncharacterized membrane protein YagU involved in acid resistance